MIHYFRQKFYLVDYLEGFIDIHNHILPGIDDGASTVDNSISLVKGLKNFGITRFIATPHIMHDLYPNTPETILDASDRLHERLAQEPSCLGVTIRASGEHMIDSHFENILESGQTMPLNEDYILVEMSYLQPSLNFEMTIDRIHSTGKFVVLAHPERYAYLHEGSKYRDYKEKNIKFQLNMLSLGGYYGRNIQRMAYTLLTNGMIDFLGSDTHNVKHLQALKEIRLKQKELKLLFPVIENTSITFV